MAPGMAVGLENLFFDVEPLTFDWPQTSPGAVHAGGGGATGDGSNEPTWLELIARGSGSSGNDMGLGGSTRRGSGNGLSPRMGKRGRGLEDDGGGEG
jgi:hypothetical protein